MSRLGNFYILLSQTFSHPVAILSGLYFFGVDGHAMSLSHEKLGKQSSLTYEI